MNNWQSMDKAPTNGTPVWLFAPDMNLDEEPRFCGEGHYDSGWVAAEYSRIDGYHSKFVHPSTYSRLSESPIEDIV